MTTKPPLGLMPQKNWYIARLQDIKHAIARYLEAELLVPKEWIEEYNWILSRIGKDDNNTKE